MIETYRARQKREAAELAETPAKLAAEVARADKAETVSRRSIKALGEAIKALEAERAKVVELEARLAEAIKAAAKVVELEARLAEAIKAAAKSDTHDSKRGSR